MTLNFRHIRQQIAELDALECLDKSHSLTIGDLHSSAFIFHLIFFFLVGNQGTHKIVDKFELRSDPITDYGVSCP